MLKRCLLYLSGIIMVLICYLCYPNYAFFIIFLMMLILPIISILYTLIIRQKVTVSLVVKDEVSIRGDRDEFTIIINNLSFFSLPNIMLNLDFNYSNCGTKSRSNFLIYAKNMDKTKIGGQIELKHVGELEISIEKSYVSDPLKLVHIPLSCSTNRKMLVMPVLTEPDYYTLYTSNNENDDSLDHSQNKSGEDSSEIFDIREYHSGDQMNRIHWKAAAKQDDIMVKEFSYPIFKSNCLLVELNQIKTESERGNLDGVYEMVYAIGNLACTKEKQFKLAYHCNMTRELKVFDILNYEDLVEAIQIMIREPSYNDNQSFYDYLESDLYNTSKLFYITSNLDQKILDALEQMNQGKTQVYCIRNQKNAGEATEINDCMIINVDHNDIKQGLKNVII